jgi:hypothetical protein
MTSRIRPALPPHSTNAFDSVPIADDGNPYFSNDDIFLLRFPSFPDAFGEEPQLVFAKANSDFIAGMHFNGYDGEPLRSPF